MMQELVEKRLSDYKKNKMKTCLKELVETATKEVDSLLIERARLIKNNLEKPLIPEKPEMPEILSPIDSNPVKPILEKEDLPSN